MDTGESEEGLATLNEAINSIVDTGYGQTIGPAVAAPTTTATTSNSVSVPAVEEEKQNFLEAHKNALIGVAAALVLLYLLR